MPLLSRLSNALWQYVSPAKAPQETSSSTTAHKNRRTSQLHLLRPRRSMSPVTRVSSWRLASPLKPTDSISQCAPSVASSPVVIKRKRLSVTGEGGPAKKKGKSRPHKAAAVVKTMNVKRKHTEAFAMDVDMDMDATLVDSPSAMDVDQEEISSMLSEIRVADSPVPEHRTSRRKSARRPRKSWSAQDAMDETYIPSPAASRSPSPDLEENEDAPGPHSPPQTIVQINSAPASFPLAAQPLIARLVARGREPILPCYWAHDFQFLPATLFHPPGSSSNPDIVPAIGSRSDADFRAQKAFAQLLTLGPRMRDKSNFVVGGEAAEVVKRGVGAYMSWALRDARIPAQGDKGDLDAPPPLVAVVSSTRNMDIAVLQRVTARRLASLEARWRAYLAQKAGREEMPVLYGVVASHSVIALVCYAPGALHSGSLGGDGEEWKRVKAEVQTVGMFDFGDKRLDVWNALALALVVGFARDEVVDYHRRS